MTFAEPRTASQLSPQRGSISELRGLCQKFKLNAARSEKLSAKVQAGRRGLAIHTSAF